MAIRKSLALAVLLVVTSLATRASAQQQLTQAAPSRFSLQVEKLGNGLTVLLGALDSPGVVAYGTLVQVGSRDEVEPGRTGVAHLVEHLMFRGTDAVSAEEYVRQIQSLGAEDGATTTRDMTLFESVLPSDALGALVKLNADRFQHLHYAADKYKDEAGAVLGERNRSFANPQASMEEALLSLAFRQHSYGHTTTGSKHDVEDMPNQVEHAREFFRRFYTPDDCTLILVGDFDRDRALAAIKDAYGGWRGTRARTVVKPESEQKGPRVRALAWHGDTTPRIRIAYHAPAMRASVADAAALATLRSAMFDRASDLYLRLVVRERKLMSLEADPEPIQSRDPGLLEVAAELEPTTSFDEVIGAVQASLNAAARGELAAADIEAARDHLLNSSTLRTQTPAQFVEVIAGFTSALGDPHGFERYAEALAAVKPDDVARVAKQLTAKHRDVVTLGGGNEGASQPRASTAVPPTKGVAK